MLEREGHANAYQLRIISESQETDTDRKRDLGRGVGHANTYQFRITTESPHLVHEGAGPWN